MKECTDVKLSAKFAFTRLNPGQEPGEVRVDLGGRRCRQTGAKSVYGMLDKSSLVRVRGQKPLECTVEIPGVGFVQAKHLAQATEQSERLAPKRPLVFEELRGLFR